MDSTLLLLQFTSQNIALFCCALFAGAATYVSLVEHPAMTEGGAKLASTYLLTSHPRTVVFLPVSRTERLTFASQPSQPIMVRRW